MRFLPIAMIALALPLAAGCASTPSGAGADAASPQITILGVHHFANPGEDEFNVEGDDVLSPQRQRELAELLDRLAAFEPTKIAVERRAAQQIQVDEQYDAYRAGEKTLGPYEVEQIGFRLARRLDHDRLYAVDAPGAWPYDEAVEYAQRHGQSDRIAAMQEFGRSLAAEVQERLQSLSLLDFFLYLNSPAWDARSRQFYLRHLLEIGQGDEYPGADVVAGWAQRNLRIAANIARIIEPGDRVLVIFGAGHRPRLAGLVQARADWVYVDAATLLR